MIAEQLDLFAPRPKPVRQPLKWRLDQDHNRLAQVDKVSFDLDNEAFLFFVQVHAGLKLLEVEQWDWLKGVLMGEVDPRDRYTRILRGCLQSCWTGFLESTQRQPL